MKNTIKILFFSILLLSCNQNSDNWELKDKEQFMKDCQRLKPTNLYSDDKYEEYCDCALNTYMQKYKDLEEANKATLEKNMTEIMDELESCIKLLQ